MTEIMKSLSGQDLPRIITSLPGPLSRAIAEISFRAEPVSLTRLHPENPPIYWSAGCGANVMDVDGNLFIECFSAFGVAAVGHGNPLVSDAIADQARRLLHCAGDVFPNPLRPALSEALLDLIGEQDEMQVTYGNSGSEAVEIGIKAALCFTRKPGILAFDTSFHGQTLGTLPLTGFAELRNRVAPYMSAHTRFVSYPNPYRSPTNGSASPAEDVLAEVERIFRDSRGSSSEIGVVVVEPVQGLAGCVFPEHGFLRNLANLCRAHDVLLFCDEILTGLGRTGHWLACHAEGVRPDIVTLGKLLGGGLAIGVCLAKRDILQALDHSWFLPMHGSTFGGDPLVCRSALAALSYVRDLSLAEINRKGSILLHSLSELQRKHPLIGHVRGRGLLTAIELVRDRATKEPAPMETAIVVAEALRRGVILLQGGIPTGNVLTLAPPFCITDEQLKFCVDALDSSLAIAENVGGRQRAGW